MQDERRRSLIAFLRGFKSAIVAHIVTGVSIAIGMAFWEFAGHVVASIVMRAVEAMIG